MMFILLLIIFIIYHIIIFSYSEDLLIPKDNKWLFRIITCIFNSILFCLYYSFSFHEIIFLIAFELLLYLELRIGYGGKHLKSLFISLCFAVTFFAVRLFFKATYSLISGISFYASTSNNDINILCSVGAFIICSLCVFFFKYVISNRYINTIKSSEENIKFATNVLFFIFLFQVFNTINLYVSESYHLLSLLQLKIAICLMIGFFAAVFNAYLLSRLDLLRYISEEIEDEIYEQKKEFEDLKNMAYIDQDFGCYSRVYGLNFLEETIKNNKNYFSVIFFDLDGLKTVNDKYGHLEGDVYINNVVTVFMGVFKDSMTCRMGGDEFLVILRGVNEFDAYKYAIQVCEKIEDKDRIKNGKYSMSVSYGLLEVNVKEKMASDKILKLVDDKMYIFKNSRKKARFM